MILLVLFPMFGSWLNQDFAAFQPNHQHIFLDGVKPNHHEKHTSDTADGVVNLPDQTAAIMGLVFMLFLMIVSDILPNGLGNLSSPLSNLHIRLSGIYIPPNIRPPRLILR